MPTNQEQYDDIKNHITLLNTAKNSMNMLQRAEIDGVIVRLNDELIALDEALLRDRNGDYAALTDKIKGAKAEFDALDEEIKTIIKGAETAAKVFDGLTKLVGYLTRVAL